MNFAKLGLNQAFEIPVIYTIHFSKSVQEFVSFSLRTFLPKFTLCFHYQKLEPICSSTHKMLIK